MEEPKYKLEVFEGPLDLLLSLIAKNKVDIMDIPIALILDQYMEYIDKMHEMNMEVAGEFIVMAAELMLIKTKMLLPKPPKDEEEENPRDKLARALIEYKLAKDAAGYLGDQYRLYGGRMAKLPEIFDRRGEIPEHIDYELLSKAFSNMLERNKKLPELMVKSEQALGRMLSRKAVPVSDMIYKAIRILLRGETGFDNMFEFCDSRSGIVAMFAAILELLKNQRVYMRENEDGEIILWLNRAHRRDAEENNDAY